MGEQWCITSLENLSTKSKRLSTLKDIRNYVAETANLEVEITNRLLSSPEIYICLDEAHKNVGKKLQFLLLITDILELCMDNLSLKTQPFDLGRLLHKALTNRWLRIKILAVQTIYREIVKIKNKEYPNVNTSDVISLELVHHILVLLRENQENKLAPTAVSIFTNILEQYLDEPCVRDAVLETLKKADVNLAYRLYEMACFVGLVSESNFEKIEFMLDHAIGELKMYDNDDLQIKILEAIEMFVERDYGIKYLKQHKVFDMLVKRVEEIENSVANVPLSLSIMKFFSVVAGVEPKLIIVGYPDMMVRFFKSLYFGNFCILPMVFDAFVSLTLSDEGIEYLEELYPHATKDIFTTFSNYIRFLPNDLRADALDTLECIFGFNKDESDSSNVIQILHRWFRYLNNCTDTMMCLTDCWQSHDLEVKAAALSLVRTVCLYPWGVEALKNTPGFLNSILKPNGERNNAIDCAELSLIDALSDSKDFDGQTIDRLSRDM